MCTGKSGRIIFFLCLCLLPLTASAASVDEEIPSEVVYLQGPELLSFALQRGEKSFKLIDVKSGAIGSVEFLDRKIQIQWNDKTSGSPAVINNEVMCVRDANRGMRRCYAVFSGTSMNTDCAFYLLNVTRADVYYRDLACLKVDTGLAPE